MLRGLIASTMLIAAAIDTTATEPDLVKYAITQGGLLAVVLVLLWSYRRDFMRILQKDDDKIAVLTTLVEQNTSASTRFAEASDRMARAIENMERHR